MEDEILGLKRHTVELKSHHENWKLIFADTKTQLKELLQDFNVSIEHVGSTSVPGLMAKPILDIAIGIKRKDLINAIIPILVGNGYIFRGDSGNEGGFLFVKESSQKSDRCFINQQPSNIMSIEPKKAK